jgi:DNA invertase Pin-like site-specific DNA recombinase
MSTDRQSASIPEQESWAKRAAPAAGVDVVRTFQDDGIAGSEIERRTGLADLLTFCEGRFAAGDPIIAVVVWDADRLSRADSFRTAGVINRLMDAGVTRMLTQEGWVDFDSDLDRLLFNIKQDMSRAAYSKSLSKNVTRSAFRRAKEGRWVCGKPPFGYRLATDGRLAPGDASAVDTVREIFQVYAGTSASQGDVARRLNGAGVPGPRGGRWTRDAVRGVLLNRAYLGELVWNAHSTGKYHRVHAGEVSTAPRRRSRSKHRNDDSDRVVVTEAHPALVDPETFGACSRKMRANYQKRTTPIPGGGEWVLSGLLHCGDCGGGMVGHKERKHGKKGEVWTYRAYCCNSNARNGRGSCYYNRVRQEAVLTHVAGVLHESFCTPARLKELKAECMALAKEQTKGDDRERQRLRDRIAALDRQIDAGTERLLTIPADLQNKAAGKLRQWQAERDGVARELVRTEQAAENGKTFMGRVNAALDSLRGLEYSLKNAPAAVARDTIAGLVGKVTLHFDHTLKLEKGTRTVLKSIEVELLPEMSSLLGTGRSSRSASGTRTTPASARP